MTTRQDIVDLRKYLYALGDSFFSKGMEYYFLSDEREFWASVGERCFDFENALYSVQLQVGR